MRQSGAVAQARPTHHFRDSPEETLYFEGDAFFDDLLAGLRAAKNAIDLETYIFGNDKLGQAVAAELAAAARRGVQVRLLIDGFGTPLWRRSLAARLEGSGVALRFFHPIPWHFWQHRPERGFLDLIARALRLFGSLNRRNHRKTCTIDGRVSWTGSFNVSARHLSAKRGGEAWRDAGIRVSGAAAAAIAESFDGIWTGTGRLTSPWSRRLILSREVESIVVRSNETRGKRRLFFRDLIRRLKQANRRIWITTPYFVPDRSLFHALSGAAVRGVDVRLILPGDTDVELVRWVSSAFYGGLLAAGVRIHEYQGAILHSKTILVDDWATVGSSNLNHRSLRRDLELDVVVGLPQSLAALENRFRQDLAESTLLTGESWSRGHVLRKILGRLFLYFREWL